MFPKWLNTKQSERTEFKVSRLEDENISSIEGPPLNFDENKQVQKPNTSKWKQVSQLVLNPNKYVIKIKLCLAFKNLK